MDSARAVSTTAILVAIVAVLLLALGATVFAASNDAANQRLGTFLVLAAGVITALVAMLRGDAAANRLDGELDQRLARAVLVANLARRQSDVTPPEAAPTGTELATNPAALGPTVTGDPEGLG